MVRKRVQKSSERSPQLQEPAIAPIGARSHSPSSHIQPDMEAEEIRQHKHEATALEIQAKYGTITPQGQERLTFLQTKMADYTQRKLDFANRAYQHMFNSSAGDVSVTPPERKTASPIQAKLTIGQPGDKYEQEADRVAAQVVQQIHTPTTQREALPEEGKLQMKPEIGSIQRQTMPEDEELQMKSSSAGMTAPQDLETSIQQARGSGQSLANSIKQPMEQAFGTDFSGVKIHTDAQSDHLNQSIQARAFTTGQDIFFRQGEYNPGSKDGQELLAHELTHVVQQNGGAVQRSRSLETVEVVQEKENQKIIQCGPQLSKPKVKPTVFLERVGVAHEDGRSFASVRAEANLTDPTQRVYYDIKWDANVVPGGNHLNQTEGVASDWIEDKSPNGSSIGDRNSQEAKYFNDNDEVDRKGLKFRFTDGIEQSELNNGSWWFRLRVVSANGKELASTTVEVNWKH